MAWCNFWYRWVLKQDFNIAIWEVINNRSEEIESINKKLNELKKQIADLSPPVGDEKDYKRYGVSISLKLMYCAHHGHPKITSGRRR
jgi:hypothetical protein